MLERLRGGTPLTYEKLEQCIRSMAKDFRIRDRVIDTNGDEHRESEDPLMLRNIIITNH